MRESTRNWMRWAGLLLVSVACVFAVRFSYLSLGFYADDFQFLQPASDGFLSAKTESLHDWLNFWNPWRGWFYRATYLTYFAVVLSAFGESPFAFHAASLILHASVIFLLGALVWRLSRNAYIAIATAILFLLWPGKEEAVWWISSASTLLASLFSLASIHLWLSWRRHRSVMFYILAVICLWLALTSKSDAICTVLALLILDCSFGHWNWRRIHQYILVGVACGIYLACETTAAAFYATNGDLGTERLYGATLHSRLSSVMQMLNNMTGKVFSLSPFTILSFAAIVALVGCVVYCCKKKDGDRLSDRSTLPFFSLWAVVAALPIPLTAPQHSGAERFLYLPLMPLSAAYATLVVILWRDYQKYVASLLVMAGVIVTAHRVGLVTSPRDPVMTWTILIGVALAVAIICYARRAQWNIAAVVAITALSSQLFLLYPEFSALIFLFALSVNLLLMQGEEWWTVTLLTILAIQFPVAILPVAGVSLLSGYVLLPTPLPLKDNRVAICP